MPRLASAGNATSPRPDRSGIVVLTREFRPNGGGGKPSPRESSRSGPIEVGAHARDVTDAVTDAVGDGGRVSASSSNAGFNLADEVGAHVGGLRVDATSDSGEEGLQGGAHREGHGHGRDVDQRSDFEHLIKKEEPH